MRLRHRQTGNGAVPPRPVLGRFPRPFVIAKRFTSTPSVRRFIRQRQQRHCHSWPDTCRTSVLPQPRHLLSFIHLISISVNRLPIIHASCLSFAFRGLQPVDLPESDSLVMFEQPRGDFSSHLPAVGLNCGHCVSLLFVRCELTTVSQSRRTCRSDCTSNIKPPYVDRGPSGPRSMSRSRDSWKRAGSLTRAS